MASSSTVNEVFDEQFGEVHQMQPNSIGVVDDGRACATLQPGMFACALGKRNYSSGIHRIRLRVDQGMAILGIRSRNVAVPAGDEFVAGRHHCSPSTYAWTTNGYRIANGDYVRDEQLPKESSKPLGFVLMLNCDEHRVAIVDESINRREDMDVNLAHAPLPWCLFVELWRMGRSRVSLVGPPPLTFKLTSPNTALPPATSRTLVLNDLSDTHGNQLKFFQDVELWRDEAHRLINDFCEKKRQAFVNFHAQRQNQNEQARLETILSSLTIDDDCIEIRSNRSHSRSILPFTSLFLQSLLESNHGCIGANDAHFVLIQNDHLCVYQRRGWIIRAFPWTHGAINDILWCPTLGQFVLIAERDVLLFDDRVMTLNRLPVCGESQPIEFYGGACVGDSLYLFTWAWGPSVHVFALRPLFELKRTYQPPCPCTTDELILHCASNPSAIAFLVRDRANALRLDVCSLVSMERFWSVRLNFVAGGQNIRCCSVRGDDWLVVSPEHSTLVHISADGEILQQVIHQPAPWYALSLSKEEVLLVYESSMESYICSE